MMSQERPPIIRPQSDWELAGAADAGRYFPRRSGAATAALVLAISALVVVGISAIPIFVPAPRELVFLGPLAALLAVAALICGIIGICTTGKETGRTGRGLALAGTILGVFAGCGGGYFTRALLLAASETRSHVQSSKNLKILGLALHNYHDTYNQFPPAGNESADEKPTDGYGRRAWQNTQFSWRVQVLPFLEQKGLYNDLNRDEPWDSPHNLRRLKSHDPVVYQSPSYDGDPFNTVYLGVVSADPKNYRRSTAMEQNRGIRFADITDGTASTIVVVEADADRAVPWPKPSDWQYDYKNPRRGLGTLRPGGFLALLADGSVKFISNTTDDMTLQRLFERNDGEVIVVPFDGR